MPGVGDYSEEEIRSMSTAELQRAQENGFKKPQTTRLRPEEVRLVASPGADVQAQVASYAVPQSAQHQPDAPSDGNVWKRKKSGDQDFITPSGQKCRLRPLQLEKLMMAGILDQVTRLEGLAQALINQAEGLPPEKQHMPTREEFGQLLEMINAIVPMAVAEPQVYQDDAFKDDPDAQPEDAIFVSDIDLMDRVAIMEKALTGLKKMDNFRNTR